jgi:IMP dehydrogenase
MTPKERLVTVGKARVATKSSRLLHKHRIEKVLVVNDRVRAARHDHGQGHPEGQRLPQRLQGRMEALRVGAAVGTGGRHR